MGFIARCVSYKTIIMYILRIITHRESGFGFFVKFVFFCVSSFDVLLSDRGILESVKLSMSSFFISLLCSSVKFVEDTKLKSN